MVVEARVLLRNIRSTASEALGRAQKDGVEGDVTWDAIACSRAEKYIDDSGKNGYRCFVVGASPDSMELQGYVASHVFGKMGVSVEVITEW